MKKLFLILAVVFAAIACNRSESVLLESRENLNKQCPKQIDKITTLTSVDYEKGDLYFVYNYTVDSRIDTDKIVKDIVSEFDNNVDSKKMAFREACVKSNVLILYRYKCTKNGEDFGVQYDPECGAAKLVGYDIAGE